MKTEKKIDEENLIKKNDFREELLLMANAKIIGRHKFEEIIDKATFFGIPLNNFIANLPKEEE